MPIEQRLETIVKDLVTRDDERREDDHSAYPVRHCRSA